MERRTRLSCTRFLVTVMVWMVASMVPAKAQQPSGPSGSQDAPRVTRVPQVSTMYGVPSAADLNALKADVVFLGVPYDLGHSSLPGTRLGPAAIRQASALAGPRGDDGFYD